MKRKRKYPPLNTDPIPRPTLHSVPIPPHPERGMNYMLCPPGHWDERLETMYNLGWTILDVTGEYEDERGEDIVAAWRGIVAAWKKKGVTFDWAVLERRLSTELN